MVQKMNKERKEKGSNSRRLDLEIILVLLMGSAHLRQIARLVGEPHTTVLRKINMLLEENVLDYSREGKNKVFFVKSSQVARNYAYSAEIYKLSKAIKKYPELGVISNDLQRIVPEGMIILFGSYAKGIAKDGSDIDIYAERIRSIQKDKISGIYSEVSVKSGDFGTKSLLIREIIKDHIIIRGVEDFYKKTGFFDEANPREEFRISVFV